MELFVYMEILYHHEDVGPDPRPLFSENVLNEVSAYIWELTRGINSLKVTVSVGSPQNHTRDPNVIILAS